jgi:hypothetical protein
MDGCDAHLADFAADIPHGSGNQSVAERRQSARTIVQLAAAAREPGQEKVQVQIVDLSPNGCRIEMQCNSFGEQWILLNIPSLTPQYCRIVWQEHGFAGLEFSAALDQSAFDSLIARIRTTEQSISALRRVGARARQMAKRTVESPGKRALIDISKECFVAAFVKTLAIAEVRGSEGQRSELTSQMIRRSR